MFRLLWRFIEVTLFNPVMSVVHFVFRPLVYLFSKDISNEEWETLKKLNCCHITKNVHMKGIIRGDKVYLKRTSDSYKNFTCPKPAVYFFIETPNSTQFNINMAGEKYDKKIIVPIKSMMRERIRIRRYDNALMYMSDYEGPGRIEEFSKSELKRKS